MDADFSTTLTAEEPRPIRVGTIQSTGFLVVGPFDFETLMRLLVSVHHSPRGIRPVNNGGSLAFRTENAGTGFPAQSVLRQHFDHARSMMALSDVRLIHSVFERSGCRFASRKRVKTRIESLFEPNRLLSGQPEAKAVP